MTSGRVKKKGDVYGKIEFLKIIINTKNGFEWFSKTLIVLTTLNINQHLIINGFSHIVLLDNYIDRLNKINKIRQAWIQFY